MNNNSIAGTTYSNNRYINQISNFALTSWRGISDYVSRRTGPSPEPTQQKVPECLRHLLKSVPNTTDELNRNDDAYLREIQQMLESKDPKTHEYGWFLFNSLTDTQQSIIRHKTEIKNALELLKSEIPSIRDSGVLKCAQLLANYTGPSFNHDKPGQYDDNISTILNEMENAKIPFFKDIMEGMSMAQLVARWNSKEAKEWLQWLQKYPDELIDLSEDSKNDILYCAVKYGHIDTVQYLLNVGFKITQSENGNTPLHEAVGHNTSDIVELLLQRGANPNAKNSTGWTPLHKLCATPIDLPWSHNITNRIDTIRSLVNHGARLEQRDGNGATPFLIAARTNNLKLAQELISLGAEKTATDNRGENASHYAVRSNYVGAGKRIDDLLKLGIKNAHLANNDGDTALDVAIQIASEKSTDQRVKRQVKDALEEAVNYGKSAETDTQQSIKMEIKDALESLKSETPSTRDSGILKCAKLLTQYTGPCSSRDKPGQYNDNIRTILNEMQNAKIPFFKDIMEGMSMAHFVARWKSREAKKWLQKYPDELIDLSEDSKNDILYCAVEYGYIDTVQYLLNVGFKFTNLENGNTPLY